MPQEKLVRDRIPEIIRAAGLNPVVRIADVTEYRRLLRAKLVEEVDEFLRSDDDPEELADIAEVVRALAATAGLDADGLEKIRAAKAAERGGFTDRVVWAGNETG